MLTDEEIKDIWLSLPCDENHIEEFARKIERAVLAKSLAQQERLHKEWSELWSPIDEAVRPLTPLGESVAAKALELINTAKAMQKQEPVGYRAKIAAYWEFFDNKEYADRQYAKIKDAHELVDNCIARSIHWSPPEPVYAAPQPAQAAAIPEGWQLVPIEPTKEMCDAYCEHSIAPIGNLSRYGYKAMLSASPKPE